MSDTINIGGITVSKFYLGGSSDVKIYLGTTKLYPHLQEPCFAVVDNISTYTARTYVDVYETSSDKWYKLNNLSAYEEYGVYGSTTATTYYDGKLVIQDGYEYQYSGSSWVNVGEVSGSTYLEYIERTSTYNGYMPLGEYFTENTVIQMDFQMTQAKGNAIIGDYGSNDNDDWRVFLNYDSQVNNWLVYDFINSRNHYNTGDWSKRFNIEIGNYYIKDLNTGNYLINKASKTSFSRPNQMYLFHMEGRQVTNNIDYGKIYSVKIYQNDTLVKDYAPWTDENGNYGLYDNVSSSVTQSIGSMTGATGCTIEYPIYYDEIQDPPNNLSFSSMTEAEEYECPWVGMHATIDGDNYIFSGDSQSGYEWVYKPSRLPAGYTEVEYVENVTPNKAYIDTGFKPNQNTRVIADLQYVATNTHPRAFGCGTWNSVGYIFNAENGIPGEWRWKFGSNGNAWLTTGVASDFNRHKVEINNGNLYLDDVVIGSTTVTTFQLTDNIGLFCFIQNGSQGGSSSGEYMFGKFYSFKIYDDGVLTMDFVPCINPNNVVGMYDIVGGAFYSSANAYAFVAGPAVN